MFTYHEPWFLLDLALPIHRETSPKVRRYPLQVVMVSCVKVQIKLCKRGLPMHRQEKNNQISTILFIHARIV